MQCGAYTHWQTIKDNGYDPGVRTYAALRHMIERELAELARIRGGLSTAAQRQIWDEAFAEDTGLLEMARVELTQRITELTG